MRRSFLFLFDSVYEALLESCLKFQCFFTHSNYLLVILALEKFMQFVGAKFLEGVTIKD
jgi:hypothetical protein